MQTDLKLTVRWLRSSPAYTIITVLTLALAIGANAAIFSVADAVLFRALPYRDPDRLLTARMENRATGERFTLVAGDLVRAIRDEHTGVGEVARLEDGPVVTRSTPGGVETVATAAVTANYFQVLGVRAHRGRIFAGADEDAGARAAMLSHRAWRQRFGADELTIGRPLVLGQHTFDIVGILPPGFVFPSPIAGSPDLVCLLEGDVSALGTGAFYPVVRLEPGVTRAEAQAELEAIYHALGTGGGGEETVPVFEDIRSALHATGGPIMRYMLAGSLLLLLLGCANLANVVLARGRRRGRQTGIRAALGATRVRLVRPVLLEAMALAAAGSIAALAVARLAFDMMIGSVPPEAYLGADVGVDRRVFVFTVLLGFAAAIVFGLAPAWFTAREDAQRLIQRGAAAGGRRAMAGSSLVAAQVGIAIVLVFGASVAGRAFLTLVREPIGFMPDDVLTVNLAATGQRGAALQDLYLRVIEEVSREPGVRAAGATSSLPRIRESAWAPVYRQGTKDIVASHVHALPGYFEAARIPVIAGRPYTMAEVRAGALVAVVSERAARALFAERDPIGATFDDANARTLTVVGVVADIRQRVGRESEPLVYAAPGEQMRGMATTVVALVGARHGTIAADIRRRVSALVPGTVVTVGWWTDRINALAAYRNPRFQSMVLGGFAAIALGLTALGVFGVVSVMVASRTKEIGIRLALGCLPRAVVSHAVRRSLIPVLAGIAGGLLGTRLLARLAESQLYEVDTNDPSVLVLTGVIVLAAGAAAAWVPARRAGRVDPVIALRTDP